jgi:enoyl-CoA hydratase/carnithine racemase
MPVHYRCDDGVALITLDRPEALNSIDLEMWQAFSEATRRFEEDGSARTGIITGSGPRAFCAGADIKTTIRRLMDDPRGNPYAEPATIMRGQSVTKPLLAAVNGVALGGGLEIVLACDLRIAAKGARFGAPEVTLGLIPGWGGTQRLVRQLPYAVAAKLVLTGELIGAEEALACGLINAVVEPDQLIEEATRLAKTLCARGPVALKAAKWAMVEGANLPLERGLELEKELFESLAYTSDVREGIAAFEERRPPQFTGG